MENLVTGAIGSLAEKLGELLKEEYNLQTGMKKRIKSLTEELESAQAALREVETVPWDQLDEPDQIWARQVREASYDMEDVLDTFLVCVKSPEAPDSTKQKCLLKRLGKEIVIRLTKSKLRREISVNIKDIMSHLEDVTKRRRRYKVRDNAVAMPGTTSSAVDPRLDAMYKKVEELVGIEKSSSELISILRSPQQAAASNLKKKIVVIAGVGGLGKTTLAKAVYDKLKGDFDCTAFVSVGRKPNPQQVIQQILIELDKKNMDDFKIPALNHIRQFIDGLREFLLQKRYFIVIDDLWEKESWETIKLAFDDNNCHGRIIITTRNREISEKGYEIYDLPPLPDDSSRELFFTRIRDHEGKVVDNKPDEVIDKFLEKCAGIPLAIITMASLLAEKPSRKWEELYRSIGFGSEDNKQAQNTMRIVSFSYYDLPAHLRTCLLYLSAFPEDSYIPKDSLVRMWVAEGFVKKKQGARLLETGEGYFYDLINRSMLEAVTPRDDNSIITSCRVHDMVLDFIRSMSVKENFFSVVSGNDQGQVLERPRRLAHHNMTMGHVHCGGDDLKMAKVRSLFAIRCVIEASDPFRGFRLLRVLVIDKCKAIDQRSSHWDFRLEPLTHLLHLRFLSISGASFDSIPEEIGRLRFLQMLDLKESSLKQCPLTGSLPEQLVCLYLPKYYSISDIFSLTRLTSLEELSISVFGQPVSGRLPTELRVLKLSIWKDRGGSEGSERDLWECVQHLDKLEHLTIIGNISLHATDFVLSSCLRHFAIVGDLQFCKLPSHINDSCLPSISRLQLNLKHLDKHDLMILGRLPELRYLWLELCDKAIVSCVITVSEKDAAVVYFPKLRCCELLEMMITIDANEEDKSISFHLWSARHRRDISKPSVSEDKLQRPIISCSTGGAGASASATGGGGAPRDCFMPCLQVLRFVLRSVYSCDDNLGFEYGLPSLRKIVLYQGVYKIRAALWSAAKAHPNNPAFLLG